MTDRRGRDPGWDPEFCKAQFYYRTCIHPSIHPLIYSLNHPTTLPTHVPSTQVGSG